MSSRNQLCRAGPSPKQHVAQLWDLECSRNMKAWSGGWGGGEGLRSRVDGRRKELLNEASFMQRPKAINNQAAAQQLVQRMVWVRGSVGEKCNKSSPTGCIFKCRNNPRHP